MTPGERPPLLQLTLHEIDSLQDPLLIPWLDLYEEAFPAKERGRVSWHIAALQARGRGSASPRRLWALLDPDENLVGMAQTYYNERYRLTYLGYFAVEAARRGRGTGSRFYQMLLERARQDGPDFLLFDVERPDALPRPEDAALAERRIAFYERQGARLLAGVTFLWKDLRLRMMAHPLAGLDEGEVLRRARSLARDYGGDLREDEAP